jgi:hypothetical protein
LVSGTVPVIEVNTEQATLFQEIFLLVKGNKYAVGVFA